MDATDEKPVVILVVGNENRDKIGVVESLTSQGTWEKVETAGVRIFSCRSTARTVVDTTPLQNIEGRSPTAIARRWISRNGLRRILFGKFVVVVCVFTFSVRERCKWNVFSYFNCWVDVFGLMFKDHRGAVMMLVNTEGAELLAELRKLEVESFVVEHGFSKNNIWYSNLRGVDDSVREALFESIRLSRRIQSPDGTLSKIQSFLQSPGSRRERSSGHLGFHADQRAHHTDVGPFFMREVSSVQERFGPWGPERVILFGKTGSGKSTLAQMMTLGELDEMNEKFSSSSGIRGATDEVEHGEGRGWYIVDTPGFGEPKGPESTISTQEVEKKIKKYVKCLEGTFSHYIYVFKKDRLDGLDDKLWKFFVLLFGQEITQHFSVVVSDADDDWVQRNLTGLQACFKGCESFLSADFPPIDKEDEEAEMESQTFRHESLSRLEESLAKQNRADMYCQYGRHSKMHVRNERERSNVDIGIEKDLRIKFLNEGANACFEVSSFVSLLASPITELTSLLTVDDNITLLPS